MSLKRSLPVLAAALAVALLPALCRALTAPEARGKLSLAWDEYDSGRCETALGYLNEIAVVEGEGGDSLLEESTRLRIECMILGGKYEAAANLLEENWTQDYDWRDGVWRSLVSGWALELTGKEDYQGALAVLARGAKLDSAGGYFAGIASATAYRAELAAAVKAGKEGRLGLGGELRTTAEPLNANQGWVRVCPSGDEWWSEGDNCDRWMKSAESKLSADSKTAWVRLAAEDFRKAVAFEASSSRVEADLTKAEGVFSRDGFRWYAALEEERVRAAAEGLGIRGGAQLLVAEAVRSLGMQKELVSWIRAHSEDASISVAGDDLVVKRSVAGRQIKFHLSDWVEVFSEDRRSWESLWNEVLAELGRPMRPYHCFCGREMVLRETFAAKWEGLPTVWKGDGIASVLLASCPNHWMMVTEDALKSWGVGRDAAVDRAASQAAQTPWELDFERERLGDREYFVFTGTGASSLARKPGLLLGLMQAMEGRDFGGQSVRVWAPMADALILGPPTSPDQIGEDGARRAATMIGEKHSWSGPIRYKSTVSLPNRPEGTFNLMSREK